MGKVVKGKSIKVSGTVKRKSVTGKALNKNNPVSGRRPTKGSKAIPTPKLRKKR